MRHGFYIENEDDFWMDAVDVAFAVKVQQAIDNVRNQKWISDEMTALHQVPVAGRQVLPMRCSSDEWAAACLIATLTTHPAAL